MSNKKYEPYTDVVDNVCEFLSHHEEEQADRAKVLAALKETKGRVVDSLTHLGMKIAGGGGSTIQFKKTEMDYWMLPETPVQVTIGSMYTDGTEYSTWTDLYLHLPGAKDEADITVIYSPTPTNADAGEVVGFCVELCKDLQRDYPQALYNAITQAQEDNV